MDRDRDETVFFSGHPSWLAYAPRIIRGLITGLVVGILAGVASTLLDGHMITGWVVLGVLVPVGFVLARLQLRRLRVTYSVTDRRVTVETGLFARRRRETGLEWVGAVRCRQTLLERALGVGSVDFEMFGEMSGRVRVRGVESPKRVAADVDAALGRRGPAYRI